jgi:hypothetical protein
MQSKRCTSQTQMREARRRCSGVLLLLTLRDLASMISLALFSLAVQAGNVEWTVALSVDHLLDTRLVGCSSNDYTAPAEGGVSMPKFELQGTRQKHSQPPNLGVRARATFAAHHFSQLLTQSLN